MGVSFYTKSAIVDKCGVSHVMVSFESVSIDKKPHRKDWLSINLTLYIK